MQALAIIALSVLAAIVYGVLHDQVTARICVEYFTIGHPPVFQTESPTLLGLGWGILATWWVGLLLGVPLAVAARAGSRPKRSAISLLRPIATLMAFAAGFALLAGMCGYLLATAGLVQLTGHLAARVPTEKHALFLADAWAHSASYLGAGLGGLIVIAWTWYVRIPKPARQP
jgi:hypothetical protein